MSEVDVKGEVLTQFTDVKLPQHLSTAGEDDLLVADYDASRVLLLNSQLQLERVLLDRNSQTWRPDKLHYNKLTSQLYVIHENSSRDRASDVISHWSLR